MIVRGAVHLVEFDPAFGSESNKSRPAIVVSNDAANVTASRLGRGVVTVVPVTSSVERVYPFQVFLTASDSGLDRDSKAQAEQIRSIDVRRVGERIGAVATASMREVDEAIRVHLAL
jgi:mRNA interferase MazF